MIEHKSATEQVSADQRHVMRNGVPIGIVKGYLATWEPDVQAGRYGKPDVFHRGAFKNSIIEHKKRGDRQIRLRDNHGESVGGFPIDKVREDETGLWVEGEINLETKRGRELYSLTRQGVLSDFSIGFRSRRDRVGRLHRDIFEAEIGEGSIVDEPKNRGSQIKEVKSLGHEYIDLDLAPANFEFKSDEARKRIDEMPFRIGNGEHAFLCGNQKYLIGDVIDDKLVAVPQAVRDAALELKSACEVTEGEGNPEGMTELIVQAERYLAKMGESSPFEEAHFYDLSEVKSWEDSELERKLRDTGLFSKSAVRFIVRARGAQSEEDEPEIESMDEALRNGFASMKETLGQGD